MTVPCTGSGGWPDVVSGIMADTLERRALALAWAWFGEETDPDDDATRDAGGPAPGADGAAPPRRTSASSSWTRALSSSNSALVTYFSLATQQQRERFDQRARLMR